VEHIRGTLMAEDLLEKERLVDRNVEQGDRKAAVKLLFDLIVEYAGRKDFSKAEALRERLYQVDPMALDEIIRSGEIIDEGKSHSMDQEHLDLWSELYGPLNSEETHALYYALEEASNGAGEAVFRQGDAEARLCLIREGQLRLGYMKDGEEIEIAKIRGGDMAGEDDFFALSVCTSSLTALSPVKLHILKGSSPAVWEKDFPGLDRKLQEYALRKKKIPDLLRKKGLDRRSEPRSQMSDKVALQLLDTSSAPLGKAFRGAVSNVSCGGTSLSIKISKKETARRLLAQTLLIRFNPSADPEEKGITKRGDIVAVQPHLFDDYSLHVHFQVALKEESLKWIVQTSESG
jgi:hypothetical protein